MNIAWENFDSLDAYKKLLSLKGQVNLQKDLNSQRVASYSVPMASGLVYNYASKQVNAQILKVLQELSDEAQLTEKFQSLYEGEVINTGENRKVLHHLVRGQLGKMSRTKVKTAMLLQGRRMQLPPLQTRYTQDPLQMQRRKGLPLLYK